MFNSKHPLILTRTCAWEKGQKMVVEQYEIGKLIRFGSTDSMHKIRMLWSAFGPEHIGEEFFLKIIPNTDACKTDIQHLLKEVNILISLSETAMSKVCNLHTIWSDKHNVYAVFEYCSCGSLSGLISYLQLLKRQMEGSHIVYFLKKMLEAVNALHKQGVIHANLKTDYVMLDSNLQVKLRGFGMYNQREEKILKGTPYYMPPETIETNEVSERSEVWTLGIMVYQMLERSWPFKGNSSKHLSLREKRIEVFDSILKPNLSWSQSNSNTKQKQFLKTIINLMLTSQAQKRITVEELLQKDVLNEIDLNQEQIKKDILKYYELYFQDLQSHPWSFPIHKKVELLTQPSNDPTPFRKVRVVKAIRFTKIGFFLQLNNHNVIAYFNDHSILHTNDKPPQSQISGEEQKKWNILECVKANHLTKYPLNLDYLGQFQKWDPQCSIRKLFFQNNSLFVQLTNETCQIFTFQNKQQEGELDVCLTFKHNIISPNEVLWQRGDEMIAFDSSDDTDSNQQIRKYLDIVCKCLKGIPQNSQISFEQVQNSMTNISNYNGSGQTQVFTSYTHNRNENHLK